MGACYWARWTWDSRATDLPEKLLLHLLDGGYELLLHSRHRQEFDRGGILRRIAWSLGASRWSQAPFSLVVTYSYQPDRTIANFYWRLAGRPMPLANQERLTFEHEIRRQLGQIIAAAEKTGPRTAAEPQAAAAVESRSPIATPHDLRAIRDLKDVAIRGAVPAARQQPPMLRTTALVCGVAGAKDAVRCDVCQEPAALVPGTSHRYFCLTCQKHVAGSILNC